MRKAPLYDALKKYENENIYPFHMPGHKQGRGLHIENMLKMDVTEVEGLDNLHQPTGVIQEAQQLAADTFGAEETHFLVNGSTGGILAAITAICRPGDTLITARNCHRSVFSGMILAGVRPKYIIPEVIESYGLTGGILPEAVEKSLQEAPEAKGVMIVSPTYEGFTSDIGRIAKIVHSMGKILIVDEAHGAHFIFHPEFPTSALESGADLVIQSIHKTLPVLTQSAMLHVQGNRVNRTILRERLGLLQSSSPSYLFMSIMDLCRYQLDLEGEKVFRKYFTDLWKYRLKLRELQKIQLLGKELEGKWGIHQVDLSKLVFYCGCTDQNGTQIDQELRYKYHIQLEMASSIHFLGITTIGDELEGYESLLSALIELESHIKFLDKKADISNRKNKIPQLMYYPREASFMERDWVHLRESVGCAAGEFVIPYPPGIPLLCPGEMITEEIIDTMIYYKNIGISIIGMKDSNCERIQVIKDGGYNGRSIYHHGRP